ncbi:hypothetical protein RDI58_007592 [Solanum bulbocastanum]|uniref:Protein kinase domain-containing protein n=1 Tax=Solanum bulbocastanum TaxID=147425 RepID=A0AAN8YHU6_SOLBU
MERGMDNFFFFNIKVGTTYYPAYNCRDSILNEDKGASDLAAATNNFSLANKIGHGGFGNVYKDFTYFENEVKLIAKLHHRNLTKLLGYYINGAEKFLVYELMANNSVDKVIFDPARRGTGTVTWAIHIVAGNKW